MSKRIQDLEKVYVDDSTKPANLDITFSDMTVEENHEFELEIELEFGMSYAEYIEQLEASFEKETDWDSYSYTVQLATGEEPYLP